MAAGHRGSRRTAAETTRLRVKVAPGASRDRIVGWLGESLKLQVRTQPEKGKANTAVISLLANLLQIPVTRLRVVSGGSSRTKTIEIDDMCATELREKLSLAQS